MTGIKGWPGPSMALVERVSAAQEWLGFGHDPRAVGVLSRFEKVERFADLSAEDREFIDEAIRRARAGETDTPDLVPPPPEVFDAREAAEAAGVVLEDDDEDDEGPLDDDGFPLDPAAGVDESAWVGL